MKSKQDFSTKLLSLWQVKISLGAIEGGHDTMKIALIHEHIFSMDETVTQKFIHKHNT